MEIGKIQSVNLREIWKHEAKDFTQWLSNNIEALSETLGMTLSVVQTKKEVGIYSADLLAEDEDGKNVVIECQLEKTDHDHLGKLITYKMGLDADTAIWICQKACPEHVEAINWLNESTPDGNSFYLLTIEAIRIGNSPAAPLFKIVCSPSEEIKEVGKKKGELATRHVHRREFWTQLLEKSNTRTKLFSNVSAGTESWISAGGGKTGLNYNYLIRMNSAYVELYIDKGKGFEDFNKKRFATLFANKDEIERAYGSSLEWTAPEGRRSATIRAEMSHYGLKDTDKWDETQNAMVDSMARFEKALKPYIDQMGY
jgi:hypothetical protein